LGLWDWIINSLSPGRSAEGARPRRQGAGGSAGALAVAESHPGGTGASGSPDAAADASATPEQAWWAPERVDRTEPVALERPDESPEMQALENRLVSQFDGHDLAMPPLPHVTEQVLRRLRDPKCSADDLARDIAEDQVIAAEFLRMANSVLYRGANRVATLKAAVTRLGSTAIRTLMMNQSLRAAVFDRKGGDAELASILWYRSLAASQVTREIAQATGFDAEEGALIGLLHDIGNVIVLRVVNEHQTASGHQIDIEAFEYLCHECHQEFGELIADAWQLPAELRSLIRDHHREPAPDDPFAAQRNMIALSDMICSMIGYGPPAIYDLPSTKPATALGLASHERFAAAFAELPQRVERVLVSLGGFPEPDARDRDAPSSDRAVARWVREIRRGRTPDRQRLGRRRYPRWPTSVTEVDVSVDGTPYLEPVRVHDVSEGGLSLSFPEALAIGQLIRIEEDDGATVEGFVANVTAAPDESGNHRVGVRFSV
jgi:HD-like signal output (HDOD) protein